MRLPAATLAIFVALLFGWTLGVHAAEPPEEPAETTPTESPSDDLADEETRTQIIEEARDAFAQPEKYHPEGCGAFTCGTTNNELFCGHCPQGEQCRWDGSEGTAGVCVPGTYGEEVKEGDKGLNPLLVTPPVPTEAPAPSMNLAAKAEPEPPTPTPANLKSFAGSSITLRNVATAISINRDAEPTYNPYYGVSLGLSPRWSFLKKGFVAASFELDRELTHSDDTTYSGETVYSDISLAIGAGNFLELPMEMKLSGDLGITLPVSKYSSARSLQLALKPGLSLSRSFPVLAGLSTRYSIRVTKNFHEYTTSQRDVPLIPQCNAAQGDCARFSNTGVRNASWQLSQAISVGLDIAEDFGVQLSGAAITSFVYPWEDSDPRLSYQPQEPTTERHLFAYGLEVYKGLTPALSIALGMSTVNPQLAPDSSYYAPFINRYSAIYFDLHLDVVKLVAHFTRSE